MIDYIALFICTLCYFIKSIIYNKTVNKNSDSPEFELVITSIKISKNKLQNFQTRKFIIIINHNIRILTDLKLMTIQ